MRGLLATACLLLIVATALFPQSPPNQDVFPVPCERLWPVAMQVWEGKGFNIENMDRQGGFARLPWHEGDLLTHL